MVEEQLGAGASVNDLMGGGSAADDAKEVQKNSNVAEAERQAAE